MSPLAGPALGPVLLIAGLAAIGATAQVCWLPA